MVRPCLCLNLKTGIFLIGIWEIVCWTVSLTVSLYNVLAVAKKNSAKLTKQQQDLLYDVHVAWALSTTLSVIRILNGAILLLGIQRGSLLMIKSWFVVKILSVGLTIGFFITSLAQNISNTGSNIFYGLSITASFYFIWVVYVYIKQMKEENNMRPIMRSKP